MVEKVCSSDYVCLILTTTLNGVVDATETRRVYFYSGISTTHFLCFDNRLHKTREKVVLNEPMQGR